MAQKFVLPTVKDLRDLIISVKPNIDGPEGLDLTVSTNGESRERWGWQTGDNSFTGGAYSYRNWAVVTIFKRSDATAIAHDIRRQLSESVEFDDTWSMITEAASNV
jgi:hypothetical protein